MNEPKPLTGIVLAAGASTRLPNKVLLPMRDGRAVIHSAVDFCLANGCGRIHLATPPTGQVHDYGWLLVRRSMYDQDRLSWVQHNCEPSSVAGTLRDVLVNVHSSEVDKTDWLIAFADNLYDPEERVPKGWLPRIASVRSVPGNDQLDGWVNQRWMDRSKVGHADLKFAGWMHLDTNHLQRLTNWDDLLLPNAMNAAGIEPVLMRGRWADIGTPEQYARYLEAD